MSNRRLMAPPEEITRRQGLGAAMRRMEAEFPLETVVKGSKRDGEEENKGEPEKKKSKVSDRQR